MTIQKKLLSKHTVLEISIHKGGNSYKLNVATIQKCSHYNTL